MPYNLKKFCELTIKSWKYSVIPKSRVLSTSTSAIKAEERLKQILKKCFPLAQSVEVMDVSGGCGAMYDISIKAAEFKGLSIVKQHKLVTEALKEEIKDMHGLRIKTECS